MAIEIIAHTEVGSGGVTNVDFTSIPGTYSDLLLVSCPQMGLATSDSQSLSFYLNGTTSTLYSDTRFYAFASTAYSDRRSNATRMVYVQPRATSSNDYLFASASVFIPDYANTTNYKQIIIESSDGRLDTSTSPVRQMRAGLWRSTSAITSIEIYRVSGSYNIAQYSTFTLYGITKA